MRKISLLVLLILFTASQAFGAVTWTYEWSSSDDQVTTFGGADLENIQDDVSGQVPTLTGANTMSGGNTFSGANILSGNNTFSGTNTWSGTNTFSGTVSFGTSVYVGTFTIDTATATGTQAITGVGFTPVYVIFYAGESSSDGEVSWGFDDGTTKECVANNHGISAETWVVSATASIYDIESTGLTYAGYISTLGTDGFTITWTRTGAPTGILTVYYTAFKI